MRVYSNQNLNAKAFRGPKRGVDLKYITPDLAITEGKTLLLSFAMICGRSAHIFLCKIEMIVGCATGVEQALTARADRIAVEIFDNG